MIQVICPVCGAVLEPQGTAWRCVQGHCFDVARQGYVNLLTVTQKHSRHPGDTREMVAARRAFLDAGWYAPIAKTLADLVRRFCPEAASVLDAGCGEGYYLSQLGWVPERWAKKWLDVYFSGEEPKFTPPLHPDGSTFRQAVWKILLQIPYGQTITYGEIARKMAELKNVSRMSAQAVGGAVGHNEISIIIPCHRVIGTNGSLTGYAGGIDRKLSLLELEHADMSYLFVPKKGTAL